MVTNLQRLEIISGDGLPTVPCLAYSHPTIFTHSDMHTPYSDPLRQRLTVSFFIWALLSQFTYSLTYILSVVA